jgi:hypothetical protein
MQPNTMTTPQQNPRRSRPLGGMEPTEFRRLALRVYGEGWKDDMAKDFGVDRITIWRWSTGRSTISVPIAIALRSKVRKRRKQRAA